MQQSPAKKEVKRLGSAGSKRPGSATAADGSPSSVQQGAAATAGGGGVGISALFDAAEMDSGARAFAGLTLLSHVFFETGSGIRPMHPQNVLMPSLRVGLRRPCNEERDRLITGDKLIPRQEALSHHWSCQKIYKHYCEQYGVHPNSLVMKNLPSKGGDYLGVTEINVSGGNYVGDRGVLPILEVARLCENVKTLNFSGNGLRNTAIEWIVHFVMETPNLCPKISRIDVSDNRITLGGGKILVLMAAERPSLMEVIVSGAEGTGLRNDRTKIDASTMRRLQEQLLENRKRAEAALGKHATGVLPVPTKK